jgi:hypothetical protein
MSNAGIIARQSEESSLASFSQVYLTMREKKKEKRNTTDV